MAPTPKAEIQRRIQVVSNLALAGNSTYSICQYAAEEWMVSRRQCERYLSEAKKIWKEQTEATIEEARTRHIAEKKRLMKIAEKAGDIRLVRFLQNDIAKLDGSWVERRQVQVVDQFEQMTDEELEDEIKKMNKEDDSQRDKNSGKEDSPDTSLEGEGET